MHAISILITFQLHRTNIIFLFFYLFSFCCLIRFTLFRHSLTCIFYLCLITRWRYVMLLQAISELQILIKMSYLLKLIHQVGVFIFVWISDHYFHHMYYLFYNQIWFYALYSVSVCISIDNFVQ